MVKKSELFHYELFSCWRDLFGQLVDGSPDETLAFAALVEQTPFGQIAQVLPGGLRRDVVAG
jgi:hypothetical protein